MAFELEKLFVEVLTSKFTSTKAENVPTLRMEPTGLIAGTNGGYLVVCGVF